MPTLPTLTVTDAQQARILAAFKDKFGTATPQATADAYLAHLTAIIKGVVFEYERKAIIEQAAAAQAALEAEINDTAT